MQQLSLKHFIVRSQVLSLYRDALRTIWKIEDQDYRKESLYRRELVWHLKKPCLF